MDRIVLPLVVGFVAAIAGCNLPGVGNGNPGSAARDLVSSTAYATLVVEIDHPSGYAPHADAVSTLKATLQEVSGRDSAHVKIEQSASIPAEPSKAYSWSEIEALEKQHRDRKTGGDTAVLYILYVAGSSQEDTNEGKVLGATYSGTSIVMFKGNILSSSSENPSPLSGKPRTRDVERAVIVHEFGHAAGLVNLGTKMVSNHEDPENKGHSSNRESVMYWAVESSAGLAILCQLGLSDCGIPHQFDSNDKADLRALRES